MQAAAKVHFLNCISSPEIRDMNRGVVFVLIFVVAAAFRDVWFADIFQKFKFFEIVLVGFSLATVIFGAAVTIRMPNQWRKVGLAWKDTLAAVIGTAAAWLSYFYALKTLEPAVVNTIHSGFGSVTLVFIGGMGARLSQMPRINRTERVLTLGLMLTLLFLTAIVLFGLSGLTDRGWIENLIGLILAFASGSFIALSTEFTRRMNDQGITPEAVLAIRFIAIIAISAGVVSSNEGSSLLAVDGALAELVLASLVLMVAPIYVLQLGIARTSAVSVWILLSIGPCLVFAVQLLDGRLAMSSHTLIGILLYSVFAIWIAFSRKYEQIPKIRVEQPD